MGIRPLPTIVAVSSLLVLCILMDFYASGSVVIKSYIPKGFICNFNKNSCGWKNAFRYEGLDNFNWRWKAGPPWQQRGTHNAARKGGGYMFIKSRRQMNRTALFISPFFRVGVASCFKFWYYMKGKTLGHLEVQLAPLRSQIKRNSVALWNLRGHQGNTWMNATIPLAVGTRGVLIFEAFDTELGKNGNILIDQVMLTSQEAECRSIYPPYAAPTTDITTTTESTTTSFIPTEMDLTERSTSINKIASTEGVTTKSGILTTGTKQSYSTANSTYTHLVTAGTEIVSSMEASTATNGESFSDTSLPALELTFVSRSSSMEFTSYATGFGVTVTATNETGLVSEGEKVATATTKITVIVVVVVIVLILILVVALVAYRKRREKPRTVFADDCSVIMTRMYPEIAKDPSIDYRKFT